MKVQPWVIVSCIALTLAACANRENIPDDLVRPEPVPISPAPLQPMRHESVLREAERFFGEGAQGVADSLNYVFRENSGEPTAYIVGEEGGAALGFGLRYGHGTLYLADGATSRIYWRGPSLGFDMGGTATRTFVLVYNLERVEDLYQRFVGVEGSLVLMGGLGVTYNRMDDIVLAPVRFGVGWRQGLNVGYLHLSPDSSWVPF